MTPLLTAQQVADQLGCPVTHVYAERSRGVLPFRRYGKRGVRFTREDVDTYLDRIRQDVEAPRTGIKPGAKALRRKDWSR